MAGRESNFIARLDMASGYWTTHMPTLVNRSERDRNLSAKWLQTKVLSAGSRLVQWDYSFGVGAGLDRQDLAHATNNDFNPGDSSGL